jgi:Rrf2 family protein
VERRVVNQDEFSPIAAIDHKQLLIVTAVTDIALNGHSRAVNSKELARRHRLPRRHLEPVLQALVRGGILQAQRGPRGGYKLAREPARISTEDILRAARSFAVAEQSGGSQLLDTVVAPLMAKAERAFLDQLSRITVEDLIGVASHTAQQRY